MALINCYECGKQISDAAPACPSCGAPKKKLTLHKSCEIGDIIAVKQHLASGADAKDEDGDTPLNYTVGETADLLRKNGGKIGTEDSIHLAVQVGNIEAVKQHIAAGTDVDAKTRGETPLLWAARFGQSQVAELLIAEGADVNVKDDAWGFTPLGYAVSRGHKESTELLIAEGAEVNAKDSDGSTPLHYAATKEVAELLIAEGADVNAKDVNGYTPLDWAIFNKDTKTVDLLRRHGGKTGEELKAEGK